MSLAHNIRYFRKKQGWGQEELANKLGYKSYTTIQKWESGVSVPPLKIIHALADLFHIPISELTGIKEKMPADQAVSGTSKERQALIDLVMSCPEERAKDLLTAMQLFLQNWQR